MHSATVWNASRPGIKAKFSTVKRWIDQCACEWVIEGRSFRELSQQDRLVKIASNMERSGKVGNLPKSQQPNYLPPINPSGEIERMPRSEVWTHSLKFKCLIEAREFCQL